MDAATKGTKNMNAFKPRDDLRNSHYEQESTLRPENYEITPQDAQPIVAPPPCGLGLHLATF